MASNASPRNIPGAPDSVDGSSNAISDFNYGSFRGSEEHSSTGNPVNPAGQREPTRSFIALSYRGAPGVLLWGTHMSKL
jgi:SulP family sulfate permease